MNMRDHPLAQTTGRVKEPASQKCYLQFYE